MYTLFSGSPSLRLLSCLLGERQSAAGHIAAQHAHLQLLALLEVVAGAVHKVLGVDLAIGQEARHVLGNRGHAHQRAASQALDHLAREPLLGGDVGEGRDVPDFTLSAVPALAVLGGAQRVVQDEAALQALAIVVLLQQLDVQLHAFLHVVVDVVHVAHGELADVHQHVLLGADVHEGAVVHHALHVAVVHLALRQLRERRARRARRAALLRVGVRGVLGAQRHEQRARLRARQRPGREGPGGRTGHGKHENSHRAAEPVALRGI
eukprot:scaffold1226_cov250-Pinguiococcus_pyrenoidosus.AAC.8